MSGSDKALSERESADPTVIMIDVVSVSQDVGSSGKEAEENRMYSGYLI